MNNLQTMTTEIMGSHARRVFSFVQEFHGDPELRARCESDPHGVLAENGVEVPLGYDVRFVADTADVHHFVLPPDPNASLEDDDLDMVVGGKGRRGPYRTRDDYLRSRAWQSFNSHGNRARARYLQTGEKTSGWRGYVVAGEG